MCELVREKGVAFVGPTSKSVKEYVKSAAATLNIPHVSTDLEIHERKARYTLSLHPDLEALNRVLKDIVEDKKWRKFAVIYDSDDGNVNSRFTIYRPITNSVFEEFSRESCPNHSIRP